MIGDLENNINNLKNDLNGSHFKIYGHKYINKECIWIIVIHCNGEKSSNWK